MSLKHSNERNGNAQQSPRPQLRPKPLPSDLYEKLSGAINAGCSVRRAAVRHIWQRHGCYENAKRQQTAKRNRGKMPSYFNCVKMLIRALESTLNRPNWTRSSETKPNGKTRFQKPGFKTGGNGRFRGKNYRKNLKKHDRAKREKNAATVVRKLHFKTFTKSIGTSGRGYGVVANADDKPCNCCCSVVDPYAGLITGFPILISDAAVKGKGPKVRCKQEASEISSSSDESKSDERDREHLESAKSEKDSDAESSDDEQWTTESIAETSTTSTE